MDQSIGAQSFPTKRNFPWLGRCRHGVNKYCKCPHLQNARAPKVKMLTLPYAAHLSPRHHDRHIIPSHSSPLSCSSNLQPNPHRISLALPRGVKWEIHSMKMPSLPARPQRHSNDLLTLPALLFSTPSPLIFCIFANYDIDLRLDTSYSSFSVELTSISSRGLTSDAVNGKLIAYGPSCHVEMLKWYRNPSSLLGLPNSQRKMSRSHGLSKSAPSLNSRSGRLSWSLTISGKNVMAFILKTTAGLRRALWMMPRSGLVMTTGRQTALPPPLCQSQNIKSTAN